MMVSPFQLPVLSTPIIRRVAWHLRRIGGQIDRRFFLTLAEGIVAFVAIAALLITVFEKPWTLASVFDSFNWGIATVLGQGDSAFVTSPAGRLVSWLLILFGVAMLGMITGALVAMVIDFLLTEGAYAATEPGSGPIARCGAGPWPLQTPDRGPYRALTAAVRAASPSFASAKSIPVFGSV
jgi:voltage-gated potassium channel